jgi:hypothetical protein
MKNTVTWTSSTGVPYRARKLTSGGYVFERESGHEDGFCTEWFSCPEDVALVSLVTALLRGGDKVEEDPDAQTVDIG